MMPCRAAHRTESIFSSPLLRFPTPAADRSIAAARALHSWCTFSSMDDSTTNRCTVVSRVCGDRCTWLRLVRRLSNVFPPKAPYRFIGVKDHRETPVGHAKHYVMQYIALRQLCVVPAVSTNMTPDTKQLHRRHLSQAIDTPDGLRLDGGVHERLHQDHVLRLRQVQPVGALLHEQQQHLQRLACVRPAGPSSDTLTKQGEQDMP